MNNDQSLYFICGGLGTNLITTDRKSHQMALNNSTNKFPRGGLTMYSVKRARDVLAVFIVTFASRWMEKGLSDMFDTSQ